VIVGDVSPSHRLRVDSHAAIPRVRLVHGGPPRSWSIVHGTVHEAALACRQLTRDDTGGQPTPRTSLCLAPWKL
jgi:hypothetical protein